MTLQQLRRSPWRLVGAATSWHLTSQQGARRNALVASTALMQQRAERLEVEHFLGDLGLRHAAPARPAAARRNRTA
jgi:hypothetical protein